MNKQIPFVVSLALLITCSIEVGRNVDTLFKQDADSVLYIETNKGEAMQTTEDLLDFDYSLDELPNAGS